MGMEMTKEELYALYSSYVKYYSDDQIKKNVFDKACSTYERWNSHRVLVGDHLEDP
jgi:hypothetical protein